MLDAPSTCHKIRQKNRLARLAAFMLEILYTDHIGP